MVSGHDCGVPAFIRDSGISPAFDHMKSIAEARMADRTTGRKSRTKKVKSRNVEEGPDIMFRQSGG
ncbi:hypothetical protein A8A04_05425 [Escherichia coli]|nr:hypothetical protein A8A04_05425 [Escherichia coli]